MLGSTCCGDATTFAGCYKVNQTPTVDRPYQQLTLNKPPSVS